MFGWYNNHVKIWFQFSYSLNFGSIVTRPYICRAPQLEPDDIQNKTDFMKMIS